MPGQEVVDPAHRMAIGHALEHVLEVPGLSGATAGDPD